MKEIVFPEDTGQKYYKTHYRFFISLATAAGKQVSLKRMKMDGRGFYFIYRGEKVLVDFGDHKTVGDNLKNFKICFRYHYSQKAHGHIKNCYPLTPISFYDWNEYAKLSKQIIYRAGGDMIQNNQIPDAAAKLRRKIIQSRLKERYGGWVDTSITDKRTFWWKARTCLVSVCVPGARNDILDRGQFQYMAFGTCTISPPLDITLPFWKRPEPGIHYITCRPDFSDLFEKIDWCRRNRDECVRIGENAKSLFLGTSTPERIWAWIDECMEGVKNVRHNQ